MTILQLKKHKILKKGHHQKSERQPMKWEKIFANNISDKKYISITYKKLL